MLQYICACAIWAIEILVEASCDETKPKQEQNHFGWMAMGE